MTDPINAAWITRCLASAQCRAVKHYTLGADRLASMAVYNTMVDTDFGAYCLDANSLIPTGCASNKGDAWYCRAGDN